MQNRSTHRGTVARIFVTVLCFTILGLFAPFSHAQQSGSLEKNESMVRAAVIMGILRFTYWPEQKHPQDQLNLCEMGDAPSANAIRNLDNLPTIGNLSVNLQKVDASDSFDSCHGLIIGSDVPEPKKLSSSVLTFCDGCDETVYNASAIVLSRRDNKVQFEVNLDLIVASEISLSASVIELASKCVSSNPSIKGCKDGN